MHRKEVTPTQLLDLHPSHPETRFFEKGTDLCWVVPLQLDLSSPHRATTSTRLASFTSELRDFRLHQMGRKIRNHDHRFPPSLGLLSA